MVGVDPVAVEIELMAGRLGCPGCGVGLAPWGSARERELRSRDGSHRFRPRRSICAGCGATHVLLPHDSLVRRRDAVADIGHALAAKAAGSGHRVIAAMVGREASTVRGWLRRFAVVAVRVREHFTRWAVALDPMFAPIVSGRIGVRGRGRGDRSRGRRGGAAARVRSIRGGSCRRRPRGGCCPTRAAPGLAPV